MAIPSEAALHCRLWNALPSYLAITYTDNEEPTMPNTNLKVSKA